MIDIALPIENLPHLTWHVFAGRIRTETDEHTIVVGCVGAEYRTIGTGFFADDKVGASHGICAGKHQNS